jgi:PAS domain S-box-containing protein
MALSIAILTLVSIASVWLTMLLLRPLAPAAYWSGTPLGSMLENEYSRLSWLALVQALALVIAGGTLLVRLCNPFLRRLEESEGRVRAILSTAGDGIITLDEPGTITSLNRAAERMFARPAAELLGRGIDEIIELPCETEGARRPLLWPRAILENSNPKALGRRGADHFPLEFSLSRVPLGERMLYTVIVRDTSDHEMAQQQLRTHLIKLQEVKEILEAKAAELAKTNRELDDFTYVASHDLKEPLRGISAYCHILLEDYGGQLDADGQRRLVALESLCGRLSQLIDDLLNYSRIGRSQPEHSAIDLNDVVADVIQTLGPLLEERHAVVLIDDPLPSLQADPLWAGEVFRNLVTNALKFNDSPRPRVEIGCSDSGTLFVRDNGIGIEPRHHEAIFTMFRRLHSRRKYDGTGAGLSIVRKIIEQHGGRVWLESEPGSGSTFYFTLGPGCESVSQELAAGALG